jgi:hypothetical protein
MKMKRETLVSKLEDSIRETPSKAISLGEISLALDILRKAKAQSPSIFVRLAPLIQDLLPA